MHILTVIMKSTPQLLQFHFNQFKDADSVLKQLNNPVVDNSLRIEDDYGSKGIIQFSQIGCVSIADLDREMEAQEKVEWAKINKDIRLRKKLSENPAARLLVPGGVSA